MPCQARAVDVVENVDLIFNDWEEYKNGNTLVVQSVFEQLDDASIHIPTL